MSTFDSTKHLLKKSLDEIVEGKIQLPDFQRGWVWDDEHIKSLLVSIARSFPVGAVMLLETGGEARFQIRPIEGVAFKGGGTPIAEKLILDGQQRLTSLTQVLMLKQPVKTRDTKDKIIHRHYYINIHLALKGHEYLDEAIIGVDEDRKIKENFGRDVKLDLSTPENEYTNFYFPCDQILNSDSWEVGLFPHGAEKYGKYLEFRSTILDAFRKYELPIIELKKETSKEAVCLVFEKVNTGGVPLSVFELITATYAIDGYNLRDDWYGSKERKVKGIIEHLTEEKGSILGSIETTDFLQAISLLHTYGKRQQDLKDGKLAHDATGVSAKRATVLTLPFDAYINWRQPVLDGFLQAARFLRRECIFSSKELPYRTQLVPLAAVMTHLKNRWMEPIIYSKIARWYWCGVLGELYGGAVETRIANDLQDLIKWLDSDLDEPTTVIDAGFQASRLDTLRSRNSAAYKGITVLVLRDGAKDFFWKSTIQELDKQLERESAGLDIHHIFPQAWCDEQAKPIPPRIYNSIINKTPISYKANRMIALRKQPSNYLKYIQEQKTVGLSDDEMDDLLRTHLITPEHLRSDDFTAFFEARRNSLLQKIEHVMGKQSILKTANAATDEDVYEGEAED